MKTMFWVIVGWAALVILNTACFALDFKEKGADRLNRLGENYGGLYIFDKEIRNEILQREKERNKLSSDERFITKKISKTRYFVDTDAINRELPRVLSNGCKYYVDKGFNFDDKPEYAYYENKFREYMGKATYKELRPYLSITSYYECKGKKYPITFYTMITYGVTSYGLFGDEAAGFEFKRSKLRSANGGEFHYFINGKFVKGNEEYEGEIY